MSEAAKKPCPVCHDDPSSRGGPCPKCKPERLVVLEPLLRNDESASNQESADWGAVARTLKRAAVRAPLIVWFTGCRWQEAFACFLVSVLAEGLLERGETAISHVWKARHP